MNAAQLLRQMRVAVNRLHEPAYVAFTFTDRSMMEAYLNVEVMRVLSRRSDGATVVVELADPTGDPVKQPFAHVVTDGDFLPESAIVRLGDFPLTDFGLRVDAPSRRGFFDAPGTPEPAASPLLVIATVYAIQPPPYRVDALEKTTIDGRSVYHVNVTPTRDAGHNVLRQIWIDAATMLPVRYVAERFVDIDPHPYTYPVTVDASVVDGALVNIAAHGLSRYGPAHWEISDISFPSSEPDWVFDPSSWKRHDGETIPGLAPP